jgi:rSAM/selenodomain-associated transferase 2
VISVIIPTFNEEENLSSLLSYLKQCASNKDMEIIVCDSPISTDSGFKIAQSKNVKTIQSPVASRAYQMNLGAEKAKSDILYFLHADARPPIEFVNQIYAQINSGYEFGIYAYKFNSNKFLLKVNSFFTRFDGFFAGGGDQSLFMKKRVFEDLGGFDNALMIMEDFDIYKRAKKSGFKNVIIKKPLIISARKYEQNSWVKVNSINLRIFLLYISGARQERLLSLHKKLKRARNILSG